MVKEFADEIVKGYVNEITFLMAVKRIWKSHEVLEKTARERLEEETDRINIHLDTYSKYLAELGEVEDDIERKKAIETIIGTIKTDYAHDLGGIIAIIDVLEGLKDDMS
ncbi:MAG: hypothetical protein ACXQTS_05365 [Candidatus Methanospirareceae archaeon]